MSTYTNPAVSAKTQLAFKVTGSFYPVFGARNMNGPSSTIQENEVTNHSSPAKEYRASPLPDFGTFEFTLFRNKSVQLQKDMYAAFVTGSINEYLLVYSDGSKTAFNGLFTGWNETIGDPATDQLEANVSVRLTGTVDNAATASYI